MQNLETDKALLLQATFAGGELADRAWRRWQESVQMDDIDAASQRALPQLYVRNGAGESLDPRIQGLHRRAWYSNKLLFEHVKPLLERLAANGDRVLVTRQTALVAKSRSCYPLDRFHIAVSGTGLEKALAAFRATGWSSESRQPRFAEAAFRGLDFERDRFLVQLTCAPPPDDAFWHRTDRLSVDDQVFEVPGLADRLLEAAAPARSWQHVGMYQRLLETLLVIEYGEAAPDWALLAGIAAAAGSTLPLADTLEYLGRDFGVALPKNYLVELRTTLVTPAQAKEYRLRQQGRSIWQRIRLGGMDYRHLKDACAAQGQALSPLAYLRLRWNVAHVHQMVRHLASKMTASKDSRA